MLWFCLSLTWWLLKVSLYLGSLAVCFCLSIPLVLAAITVFRQDLEAVQWKKFRSALYYGRVWHSRILPTTHAFTYPLFLFCLDLHDEVEKEDIFATRLYPLSLIVNFRPSDHLKNGEGSSNEESLSLSQRLLRLVTERTQNHFTPTTASHRVLLVTHLSYFGYCFNPVSFYYIQNKSSGKTDAVVGEVSNTPWNEMHCYVLHEKSVDDVSVSVLLGADEAETSKAAALINYVFPKAFHVSPFMEMEYKYDWTFTEKLITQPVEDQTDSSITIVNEMRSISDNKLAFRAKMQVERMSLHPFRTAYHVTIFPVYCMVIQIWIHVEAFKLFLKGVAYQPHPKGSETTASRIIGNLMVPLFAMKGWIQNQAKAKEE